jgi:alpha-beta hydrolase superfamily lysophospholipase
MHPRVINLWNSPHRWVILLAAALAGAGLAAAIALAFRLYRAAVPETPSAFYTPPAPLPQGEPGTLLRQEASLRQLPERAQAWWVMYLSRDLDGEAIAVTGTVVAPAGPSAAPRPVIAWAHGTTGLRPACGVSHTRDPYQQTPAIEKMLAAGYVVAITDYPGLGTPGVHPYMVGPVAAQAVLDSVRAARQIPEVSAGDRFVVWGASQGGNSALWTAQLAADYAPELKLLGAAASAPALDLPGIAAFNLDKPAGGIFLGMVFAAWASVYPEADLDRIIKPEERASFDRMVEPCFTAPVGFLLAKDHIRTPQQYLSVDILNTEPWPALFEANSPRAPIDVPMVIAHGTDDPLIPLALSEAEAARRCEAGEDVQLARFPGSSHDAREDTAGYILGWVGDRFADRPTASNCPG